MAKANSARNGQPNSIPKLGDESILLHPGDPGLRQGAKDFNFLLKKIAGMRDVRRAGYKRGEDDSMAIDFAGAKACFEDVFLHVFGHRCSDTAHREGFVMALASFLTYETKGLAVAMSPRQVLENFEEDTELPDGDDTEQIPANRAAMARKAAYESDALLMSLFHAIEEGLEELPDLARSTAVRVLTLNNVITSAFGDEQLHPIKEMEQELYGYAALARRGSRHG